MRNFQIDNTWYNRSIVLKEDLIMAKQHDKQFKLDAVQYYFDHKELGVRGSGNYASDEQKEIVRLRRELRDV